MPNITLKRFMIFNSNEGQDEGREGDKLLYHWVKGALDNQVSLNEQIDDICLCDASVNVSNRLKYDISLDTSDAKLQPTRTSRFKHNDRKESLVLTFDTTLVLIVEVEPAQSIWMAVHVAPPCITESTEGNSSSSTLQTDPSCIPSDAIEKVINNLYARFCLLNGTFDMLFNEIKIEESSNPGTAESMIRKRVRSICENYFNGVLPNIHLNSMVSNVASLYNYILYLDLNCITLMKVNSFINHLVCIDANHIRHTIVIFNDQLLLSSLNMNDTRILYNYTVSVLIRDALQEELSQEVDKVRKIRENMVIFLTDPISDDHSHTSDIDSGDSREYLTKSLSKFYLTMFRSSNNMTLGIIIDEPNMHDLIDRCERMLTSDSRLGVIPLVSLAQSVGQNFLKVNSALTSNPNQTSIQTTHSSNSNSSSSSSSWSKFSGNIQKQSIPSDIRFVFIDRLDASISWPLSMDMLNKEHLLLAYVDSNGVEIQPGSRKMRLIRYLIELEPELNEIELQSGCLVKEFYGKTHNDSWLTVTNSKYRTIYSIHNVKNSNLTEAQLSANNLKSFFGTTSI